MLLPSVISITALMRTPSGPPSARPTRPKRVLRLAQCHCSALRCSACTFEPRLPYSFDRFRRIGSSRDIRRMWSFAICASQRTGPSPGQILTVPFGAK